MDETQTAARQQLQVELLRLKDIFGAKLHRGQDPETLAICTVSIDPPAAAASYDVGAIKVELCCTQAILGLYKSGWHGTSATSHGSHGEAAASPLHDASPERSSMQAAPAAERTWHTGLHVSVTSPDLPQVLCERIARRLHGGWVLGVTQSLEQQKPAGTASAGGLPSYQLDLVPVMAQASFVQLITLMPELVEPYQSTNEAGATVRRYTIISKALEKKTGGSTGTKTGQAGSSSNGKHRTAAGSGHHNGHHGVGTVDAHAVASDAFAAAATAVSKGRRAESPARHVPAGPDDDADNAHGAGQQGTQNAAPPVLVVDMVLESVLAELRYLGKRYGAGFQLLPADSALTALSQPATGQTDGPKASGDARSGAAQAVQAAPALAPTVAAAAAPASTPAMATAARSATAGAVTAPTSTSAPPQPAASSAEGQHSGPTPASGTGPSKPLSIRAPLFFPGAQRHTPKAHVPTAGPLVTGSAESSGGTAEGTQGSGAMRTAGVQSTQSAGRQPHNTRNAQPGAGGFERNSNTGSQQRSGSVLPAQQAPPTTTTRAPPPPPPSHNPPTAAPSSTPLVQAPVSIPAGFLLDLLPTDPEWTWGLLKLEGRLQPQSRDAIVNASTAAPAHAQSSKTEPGNAASASRVISIQSLGPAQKQSSASGGGMVRVSLACSAANRMPSWLTRHIERVLGLQLSASAARPNALATVLRSLENYAAAVAAAAEAAAQQAGQRTRLGQALGGAHSADSSDGTDSGQGSSEEGGSSSDGDEQGNEDGSSEGDERVERYEQYGRAGYEGGEDSSDGSRSGVGEEEDEGEEDEEEEGPRDEVAFQGAGLGEEEGAGGAAAKERQKGGKGGAQALAYSCELQGLSLDNCNAAEVIRAVFQVVCDRCPHTGTLILSSEAVASSAPTSASHHTQQQSTKPFEAAAECTGCHARWQLSMRPKFIHDQSNLLCALKSVGCRPLDLLPSMLAGQCGGCGAVMTMRGVQVGLPFERKCSSCHQTLGLSIPSVAFIPRGAPTGGQGRKGLHTGGVVRAAAAARAAVPKGAIPFNGVLQVGQPLQAFGTCRHYHHSYRWLRFPCCGMRFPCDLCHEEMVPDGHDARWATRMVCGFCSTEQPVASQCKACGKVLARGAGNPSGRPSRFWEGGEGCRDKKRMNRNDPHKYRNSDSKTKSAKHKRVGPKAWSKEQKKAERAAAS